MIGSMLRRYLRCLLDQASAALRSQPMAVAASRDDTAAVKQLVDRPKTPPHSGASHARAAPASLRGLRHTHPEFLVHVPASSSVLGPRLACAVNG